MRIYCSRCQSTAVIQSSSQESEEVKKLYCTCNNPNCGHSFVMDLTFSHTLSPSAMDMPRGLLDRIARANPQQQRDLFGAIAQAG